MAHFWVRAAPLYMHSPRRGLLQYTETVTPKQKRETAPGSRLAALQTDSRAGAQPHCHRLKVESQDVEIMYLLFMGSQARSCTESSWPSRLVRKIFCSTSKHLIVWSEEAIDRIFPLLSKTAAFAG